jgi:hypothetical protein
MEFIMTDHNKIRNELSKKESHLSMDKIDYTSMLHFFLQRGQPFYSPMRRVFIKKELIYKHMHISSEKVLQLQSNMTLLNVHLLDLPDEILFLILKKLDNIDVLYSLLNVNNQRLDNIAQDKTFSTILNFVSMSSNDNNCSISGPTLDRFCFSILPRIHYNVKCLILESASMERILLAGNYSNLTNIELFNFNKEIFLRYFTGKKFMCLDRFPFRRKN